MHRPVIYREVKPLHRDVAYPTVPHELTQNDEVDRGLLRTGHHRRKSERICGMVDTHSVHMIKKKKNIVSFWIVSKKITMVYSWP